MYRISRINSPALIRTATAPLLMLALTIALAVPAAASRPAPVIVLPGASSAEGIASGRGATFFAGDLFRGDIPAGTFGREAVGHRP